MDVERYRKWESDDKNPKDYQDVRKMEAYFRVEDIDEILKLDKFPIYEGQPVQKVLAGKGVPVYDIEATAGDLQFNGDMPEVVQGYINLPSFRGCVAFVYVRGDSMYSILKAGDLIGLIPVEEKGIIQYGNVYLVVTKDNQRMVKFVRKSENPDNIILRSKNKEYDDIEIPKNKVRKMFMVKGPIRDDWQ